MKVRSSSGKPVAWRRAQTIARSSSVAFQGSLCGRLLWSWQSCGTALAPLADGLGAHAEALGQHAGGLGGAGNLLADGRGGAGLGMKGVHQILHQARAGEGLCRIYQPGHLNRLRRGRGAAASVFLSGGFISDAGV